MKKIVLVLVVLICLCVVLFGCSNSKCSIVAKQQEHDPYTGTSLTSYLVRIFYKETYFNEAIASNTGLKIDVYYGDDSTTQRVVPYGSELSNIYNNNNSSLGVQKNVFEPKSYIYFWIGGSDNISTAKIVISVDNKILDTYTLKLK